MRPLLLLLVAWTAAAQYANMGLAFNETMSGFQALGNVDYQTGFLQGKSAGQQVSFTIRSTISSMEEFSKNSSHMATVQGTVFADYFTTTAGAPIVGGILQIYDGGVQDGCMYLHYNLPFRSVNGTQYSLQGIKYVYGNECEHFLAMMTTLYIHIHTGALHNQGVVVSSGIATIPFFEVAKLIASFQFVGNGTDADKLNDVLLWAQFLVKNIEEDCVNISNFETNFWYIWASNGQQGFLLDMIQRPTELELRLALYDSPAPPVVTKQYLSLGNLSISGQEITMGPLSLTDTTCVGQVNGTSVSVAFTLGNRNNQFVPQNLDKMVAELLPNFTSRYGNLSSATVNGITYSNIPLVSSRYPIRFVIDYLQWAMLSAMSFPNTDLQIEIVSMDLMGVYLGTSYVYYLGKMYQIDDPFLFETRIGSHGAIVNNNSSRLFTATIETLDVHLEVNCSAPVAQFALLDTQGATQIHTALTGQCAVTDVKRKTVFSTSSALLEVKANPSKEA